MTDRVHALTVVLDRDIRTDDIEPLISAIKHLRYVADVTPHIVDHDDILARARARHEATTRVLGLNITRQILDALEGKES